MADRRAVVVARRAAELAVAGDVDLPDDLALWRLAGGRPDVGPAPGTPDELGDLLERSLDVDDRRRRGSHFTPGWLAEEVVARGVRGHHRPAVGDPACGGGAVLLAAARHLAAAGEDPRAVHDRLWAVDVDPLAVATTEVALALWAGAPPRPGRCAVGDALLDDLAWPALEVVLGNPPFLSPLSTATARSTSVNGELRDRYGPAVLAYTDTAALFLLRGCDLVRPGGTVALLQPQSVLAARDARGVRAAVAARGTVREVFVPDRRPFGADVDVCLPVVDVGTPDAGGGWGAHLARTLGVPAVALARGPVLGDEASPVAGFRSEYYGMVGHVHEQVDRPEGRPLLTTGLVDLGGTRWGERPARVGGRTWARPVIDAEALEGRAAQWLERTAGPKLVVATQTRVVEVAVDEAGAFVAGVPLVVVRGDRHRLWHLAAALAAPAVCAWLLQEAAGTALSSGAVRVSAPLLRDVPLPPGSAAWDAGASAFREHDLEAFVEAMATAYDVGPEVGTWWTDRARSVWSPVAVPR